MHSKRVPDSPRLMRGMDSTHSKGLCHAIARPPAQPAINAANEFAAFMRDSGAQPPERIALDPDGGIVFEWGDEIHAVTIEIDPTGSMELIAYRHNRIQARHVLA
jgi:hypothetical protein